MHKKYLFLPLLFVGALCLLFMRRESLGSNDDECPFCSLSVLNDQKFYEDDLVIALCSHKPVLPGHCLVIPKRHVDRFEMLTDAEVLQMGKVIKKVNQAVEQVFGTSAYFLLQKNGLEVGQSVPHTHIHYVPRKAHDGSTLKLLAQACLAKMKKPVHGSNMQALTDSMKQSMSVQEETLAQ